MLTRAPNQNLLSLRQTIGSAARTLRRSRSLTQEEVAASLGMSQAQLSMKERGETSFTAEQLIELMRLFNAPLHAFVPAAPPDAELQNALARLGASHLRELADITPGERHSLVLNAVLDVLIAPSSARLLTALAPVLVNRIHELNLSQLHRDLQEHGLTHRLGWLVQNTVEALALRTPPSAALRRRDQRATVPLAHYLSFHAAPEAAPLRPQDLLDPGVGSARSHQELLDSRSEISRRWGVASALHPRDFAQAIQAADEQV